jgi:glycosyltransferase involved in cell wall biosynthesis
MRALPRIMAARPGAQIVIVGGNGTAYGAQPPPGQSWKSIFLREVGKRIDLDRVHFTDHLPYRNYLRALQISSAHVYLTYPFVLSWSVIEAMSVGCVVIASDTAPVREVIENNRNGLWFRSSTWRGSPSASSTCWRIAIATRRCASPRG